MYIICTNIYPGTTIPVQQETYYQLACQHYGPAPGYANYDIVHKIKWL